MSAYTAFQGDLELIPTPQGWKATRPLVWHIGRLGSGVLLVVPELFVSDGPSVPWWARWLFNPNDPRFQKAARLHDYALDVLGWSAWTASAIFYDALMADGVEHTTRWTMSLTVLFRQAARER